MIEGTPVVGDAVDAREKHFRVNGQILSVIVVELKTVKSQHIVRESTEKYPTSWYGIDGFSQVILNTLTHENLS